MPVITMRAGTTQVWVCSKTTRSKISPNRARLHLISGVGNDTSSSGEQDSEENTKTKNEFSTCYSHGHVNPVRRRGYPEHSSLRPLLIATNNRLPSSIKCALPVRVSL